jgi:hypothetical protein
MPLICIGPVCVPISAVLPLLLWALRPIWEALPEPVRVRIEAAARPVLDWLDERVLSKMRGMLGGKGKAVPLNSVADSILNPRHGALNSALTSAF